MRNLAGYTFLEIVVVLVIVALISALAYPSMSATLDNARMNGTARDLVTLLKYAREKSRAEQMTTVVVLRQEEKDLTIFDDEDQVVKHYPLWDKLLFHRILLDGIPVETNEAVVWFYPDGRSTGVALVLGAAESGRQLRLKTDILTGNTRIYRPGEEGFEDELFIQ
ncbi:MAG: prepilin-type N-terminal cleavage/methylation domain-containing protein [Acidobacteria bacterium]|nr:prepilin-type N-terminal cleavage/methylation domain-containing protein [Acidobacteriota bacterium]